jgi:hypothetical protein
MEMNLTMKPAEALALIQRANQLGIPHSFVQIDRHQSTLPDRMKLLWEPSEPSAKAMPLEVHLYADGTWKAVLSIEPFPDHVGE